MLGIRLALDVLEPDVEAGTIWLRRSHGATVFGGRPPLSLMTTGALDDLLTTRRYLDGVRNGIHPPPNAIDRDVRHYTTADIVWIDPAPTLTP